MNSFPGAHTGNNLSLNRNKVIPTLDVTMSPKEIDHAIRGSTFQSFREGSYEVSLARSPAQVDMALRLRHKVFKTELTGSDDSGDGFEFDDLDLKCRHLLVTHVVTGEVVGTYRLNTLELAGSRLGFYSAREFAIDTLPDEILTNGVEIGRACIAREHRNSRVLFLMWKGLMRYLSISDKRYFFGCCSIFTNDPSIGASAYKQLLGDGHVHKRYFTEPLMNRVDLSEVDNDDRVELPNLFSLYLKLGAKVCSPPMFDDDFGTVDFFVVLDTVRMNDRYRRMFA